MNINTELACCGLMEFHGIDENWDIKKTTAKEIAYQVLKELQDSLFWDWYDGNRTGAMLFTSVRYKKRAASALNILKKEGVFTEIDTSTFRNHNTGNTIKLFIAKLNQTYIDDFRKENECCEKEDYTW